MKIKIIFLTLLLISFINYAQDYNKEIRETFDTYIQTILDKDFKKTITYIPNELFEYVPKEQMTALMEQAFNNPNIIMKFKNPKILKLDKVEKINNKLYALLDYSVSLKIKVLAGIEETKEEKEERIRSTKISFNESFGADNVKYNEETAFYEINTEKQLYAISNTEKTDWKFLTIEKNLKPILEKILPKQLAIKI